MGTHKSLDLVRLGVLSFVFVVAEVTLAAPQFLSYQGRIVRSDNAPLEEMDVQFEFSITNPDGDCRIYRETSSLKDMRNSKGLFDVPIGSGSKNFPSSSTFKVLDAFKNGVTYPCEGGGSYLAVDGDIRLLRVQFKDSTGWKLISPDNQIRSVPFAGYAESSKSAQKLNDKVVSDFVLKADLPICTSGKFLRHIAPLGTFTCDDVSVSGSNVAGNITGSAAGFTGNLSGDVSGTQSTTSVDKIKNIPVIMTGLASGKVLKYNGTNWAPADDDTGGGGTGGITALTGDVTATGTGSVTATLADNTVTTAKIVNGTILDEDISGSASIADSKLANITTAGKVSGSAITSGTIGGTTSINTSGLIQTSNSIRFYSDSNKYSEVRAPAGLADDLLFQLPATAGTSGQVLTTNGAGILSWQTISSGGGGTVTSVTASAPVSSSGGATPNITISQAATAADGYLSSTDWNTFNNKLGTATTFGGDVSGTYNAISVNNIKGKVVVPGTYATGQTLRYDGTNWVNALINAASDITGTLSIANGGTGATTAAGARINLELGTAATVDTGNSSGKIPLLGLTGLTADRICTADSTGNSIQCNTNVSALSPWTTAINDIYSNNTGNVGIGTNSPTYKLHVNGRGYFSDNLYLGFMKNLEMNGGNILGANRIGINITPVAQVDVNANAAVPYTTTSSTYQLPDNGSSGLRTFNSANTNNIGAFYHFGTTNLATRNQSAYIGAVSNSGSSAYTPDLVFGLSTGASAYGEKMRLTKDGNLALGTTATTYSLDIYRANANANIRISSDNTSTSNARNPSLLVENFMGSPANSAGGSPAVALVNYRGKSDSTNPMLSGESLGSITFAGSSDTNGNYIEGAAIWARAAQNFSGSAGGTSLIFYTTSSGQATPSEKVYLMPSGDFGIGRDTPAAKLDVNGGVRVAADTTCTAAKNGTIAFNSSNIQFCLGTTWQTLSTSTADFKSDGTVSMTAPLKSYSGAANTPGLTFAAATNVGIFQNSGKLGFSTAGIERMTVAANGNVGIGITAPEVPLHVGTQQAISHASTSNTGPMLTFVKFNGTAHTSYAATASGNDLGSLNFGGSTSTSAYTDVAAGITATATGAFTASSTPTKIAIKTTPSGSATALPRITILDSGNVGIGTTTPGQLLSVNGGIEAGAASFTSVVSPSATFGTSVSQSLYAVGSASMWVNSIFRNTASDGYSGVGMRNSADANTGYIAFGNPTAPIANLRGALGIGTLDNAIPIVFMLNNAEAVRISLTDGFEVNGSINIKSPGTALKIAGTNICTASGCTTSSDRRLKEHVEPLNDSLEKILSLEGVQYDYIDKDKFSAKHQVGLIAQDVEREFPEVVYTDKDSGLKSIAYGNLVAPIIEAIKEIYGQFSKQDRKIASLEESNQALKLSNEDLQKQSAEMQKALCELGKKSFCK